MVSNGAPTLFSMMFSAMFMDDLQGSFTGFPIRYRFDGKLFKLRRLQAKAKVQNYVLDELHSADDIDKNARSEAKTQRAMDQVSQLFTATKLTIRQARDNFDITINTPTSTCKTIQ